MQISFCNSNDKDYQKRLNAFLTPIFLDFQFWYDLNLWDSNYESYSIISNGEIISNICVYKSDILFNGKRCQALSMGAVATKEGHRGNGYSRLLMEHVIDKYRDTPIYLSANDTVIDFYPRFGFERVYEKTPIAKYHINNAVRPQKLSYDSAAVWDHVHGRINYSKKFDCLNTASINIFHIHSGYLSEDIYNIPELDTVVIAEQQSTVLKITGVFSLKEICFADLARFLPFKNVEKIEFGFMPCWDDLEYEMVDCDPEPLFVRDLRCDLGDFKFPELSVT